MNYLLILAIVVVVFFMMKTKGNNNIQEGVYSFIPDSESYNQMIELGGPIPALTVSNNTIKMAMIQEGKTIDMPESTSVIKPSNKKVMIDGKERLLNVVSNPRDENDKMYLANNNKGDLLLFNNEGMLLMTLSKI